MYKMVTEIPAENRGRRTTSDYRELLDVDEVDKVNQDEVNSSSISPTPTLPLSPRKNCGLPTRQPSNFEFPLHSAVKHGRLDDLTQLLERENSKSDILRKDLRGRTPLHYAASFANHKCALKCVTLILAYVKKIAKSKRNGSSESFREEFKEYIDIQDFNGETALHLAAINEHKKIVEKLLFSAADVNIRSNSGKEAIHLIYSKVPEAMISIMDRSISCLRGEPHDENLMLEVDFGSIMGIPDQSELEKDCVTDKAKFIKLPKETELLGYILRKNNDSPCQDILLHPFVQLFLHLKWKKIKVVFWASIIFHVVWLILYTKFTLDVYVNTCPYKPENITNSEFIFPYPAIKCELALLSKGTAFALLGISIVVGLKEIFEMCSIPKFSMYFFQLENLGQWMLIFSVFVTAWPVFFQQPMIPSWQYQAAAFGIFLAWALILSQIGKLPNLGIYVEILGKVLKSFALFIMTFASLLIAFALSLSILMPDKQAFHSLPLAMLKVLVMMTGELNYDEVFHGDEESPPFPVSGHILYGVFTIIVTIILFNLLIGFTVSDIQGLQIQAQASGLASQLEQIFLIESFILSDRIQSLFSCFKRQSFLEHFLVVTDGNCEDMSIPLSIKKVPPTLQKEIRRLVALNISYSDEEESELLRNSTDNFNLKKRLKVILEEIITQWDFL